MNAQTAVLEAAIISSGARCCICRPSRQFLPLKRRFQFAAAVPCRQSSLKGREPLLKSNSLMFLGGLQLRDLGRQLSVLVSLLPCLLLQLVEQH